MGSMCVFMSRKLYLHIFSFFLIGFIFLTSCQNDDPLPLSISGFTIQGNENMLEIGHPVQFINLSTNADHYLWVITSMEDTVFESTDISPEYTFLEAGSYDILLTAFTQDNQTSTELKTISIKKRNLKAFSILNIKFDDTDGLPWDADGTGPDIVFVFGPKNDTDFKNTIITDTIFDVQPQTLPIEWEIVGNTPYYLTNENYELTLIDIDKSTPNPADQRQIMFSIVFNPVLYELYATDNNGNGLMQISVDGFAIDLFFQITFPE